MENNKMRPTYERDFDRNNEQYVKDYIEASGQFILKKSEPFAPIDGLLFRGKKHVANVEIKTRTNTSDKYPTYMISTKKIKTILHLSEKEKVMPLLVVKFKDGVFAVPLRTGYEERLGGRYDRNDSCDTETCTYIPMTEFKQI